MWSDIGNSNERSAIVKISAGEKVILHVLSEEPYSFRQHYFQAVNRGAICAGSACPACQNGHSVRKQHAFVVYDLTAGEVKIWVMGNTVAEQLKAIYDEYGHSLADVDLSVKRVGTGKSTKYIIMPMKTKYSNEADDVELPNLSEIFKPSSPEKINNYMNGILLEEGRQEDIPDTEETMFHSSESSEEDVKDEDVDPDTQKEIDSFLGNSNSKRKKESSPNERMRKIKQVSKLFANLSIDRKKAWMKKFKKASVSQFSVSQLDAVLNALK